MSDNTLTGLIPDIYAALDVVSRELIGLIPAVTLDAQASRAAVNQAVTSPVAPAVTASDISAGAYAADAGQQTIGTVSVTMTKARKTELKSTGEEQLALNSGAGYLTVRAQQFLQAFRTLANEMEADLAALYKYSSRAYGTAGTTPFATAGDFTDGAEVRKILVDNGAPTTDLQLVINTAAGAKFRGKQSQAYMAGTTSLLYQGVLIDMHGMQLRESAQIKTHTKGTGASYQSNNASGYAIDDATIAVDTGSGTVLSGDVVTFTGDTNKYLVTTALSGGSLTLGEPGLKATLADNVAMAVGNNYSANMAFSRSAIVLATRTPAIPAEGDIAVERMQVTDPVSGITFEIAKFLQYHQVKYEVQLVWGVKCVKPEHCAILLG